ncbi:Formiminotransferase subdomain-containing protein [Pelagophyceae sp. CCMP2097]|nr:Formiminotransferase subdomain-containing protein [Pelagophyceae sp. CCMP2097]
MARLVATVYVSEARRAPVLARLLDLASNGSGAALLTHFHDVPYDRSSFCVGGPASALRPTIRAIAAYGIGQVDFTRFEGAHPALGVVDHAPTRVSIAPLDDDGDIGQAAALCRDVAVDLGGLGVACLLYGAARHDGRTLAATRRATPYFSGLSLSDFGAVKVDVGPNDVDPAIGLCCCGATPHVLSFNVQLDTADQAVARRIARDVRTRTEPPDASRLPGVEALALRHTGGLFEVACNLLNTARAPPAAVLARVEQLARLEGVGVRASYAVGLTREQLRDKLDAAQR